MSSKQECQALLIGGVSGRTESVSGTSTEEQSSVVSPFLKWAGGKRWLVADYADLFPKTFNRYIEPFLGSGAVFFHMLPKKAILGDSNAELMNSYSALKRDWRLVHRYLLDHNRNHCQDYYYRVRNAVYRSSATRAARLIYLNRTCWNGLYRVNRNSVFNVPIGTRSSVVLPEDDFGQVAQVLRNATLHASDFEPLVNEAKDGDLLFVDPPYTAQHNNNGFIKYNEKLFSWSDQVRLFSALVSAKGRGVKIVATNACSRCIAKLYSDTFLTTRVRRRSSISSKPNSRRMVEEYVFRTE